VRFRNAARTGLGLALAVLVAKTASVDHAFWVVLGALAVLRSNALGTGATALQALLGALVGFGVASAVMLTISGEEQVLWVLLPVVVFLAGYTPGAVNFVVGQAAFTVFVVVMFNVLIPEGWRTGLVRVQDVAIGAGISVAIGALLWPRGARGVARRSFAELLRAGVAHVRVALDAALDHSDVDVTSAARRAADARDRAVAALEDLAVEHGGGHVDRQAWNGLLVDALVLQLAAEGILRGTSGFDRSSACTATVSDLEAEGQVLSASVNEEADRLLTHGVLELADEPGRHLLPPSSLAACVSAHTPTGIHDAVGLVWVHEWIALAAERTRADPRARGARSQR
jgi:uncharacterized membrane protein YccC